MTPTTLIIDREFRGVGRKLEDQAARFWTKVQKSDACWEWTGAVTRAGYGHFAWYENDQHRQGGAHRYSWMLAFGHIPEAMLVCHRCDNRRCVRPEHLFLGTFTDNEHDKIAKGRKRNQNTGKTHCVRGHEFTAENTIPHIRGGRMCRACKTLRRSQ